VFFIGTAFVYVNAKLFDAKLGVPLHPTVGTVAIDVVFPIPYGAGGGEARYHAAIVGSACANASRISATFSRPLVDGCVPSVT